MILLAYLYVRDEIALVFICTTVYVVMFLNIFSCVSTNNTNTVINVLPANQCDMLKDLLSKQDNIKYNVRNFDISAAKACIICPIGSF